MVGQRTRRARPSTRTSRTPAATPSSETWIEIHVVTNFTLPLDLYVSVTKVDEVKINHNAVFSRHRLVGPG